MAERFERVLAIDPGKLTGLAYLTRTDSEVRLVTSAERDEAGVVPWIRPIVEGWEPSQPGEFPLRVVIERFTITVETAKKSKAKFVVYAAYEDPRPSQFVTERVNIPLVKLPFTVGGTEDTRTLMDFYRSSVDRLLDGLAGRDRN